MTLDINDMDLLDRAAMLVGTGLMAVGVVVLGLVETLAGEPYGAAPLTNEAGEVVATPMIDPNIRVGLVVLGLVVLAADGLYKLVRATPETDEAENATAVTQ